MASAASAVVHRTLIADDLTPVSAFARLAHDSPRAFLFESVVGGERIARFSFVGVDPVTSFSATRERVTITDPGNGAAREVQTTDPLCELEGVIAGRNVAHIAGLPRFLGGAVGYAAYDLVRYHERLPAGPPDDRGLPDILFDIYESLVIFDHVKKLVHVVALPGDDTNAAAARADRLIARLGASHQLPPVAITLPPPRAAVQNSNFTRPAFEQAVERCKEYIRAGDIFQVVLSQRFESETAADPFNIYRALRVVNPSPFMFYVKTPEVTLVGSSPEIMCRVEDGVITSRPIAGTRPRGSDDADDRRLKEELLADPKERAEHIMLVDLARNDVGRIAKLGSVKLSELMQVDFYSHVMHICSTVTGQLSDGKTALDALRATLPVGTVSGAPKVRAMEIIDEFEPTRRGPYAGAVGYIDFAGNMDTCIALRTMVIQKSTSAAQPWRVFVQAGAGIVADSIPSREYDETCNKAAAMFSAIRLAEERFARS